MVNKVTFAGFRGRSPQSLPVDPSRQLPESPRELITKIVNLKLKLGYLSSQKKIKFFQRHILSQAFCHFPYVRMRENAFREEAFAGPQSGRIQK